MQPITAIELAIQAGQQRFGENYVQEGVEKIQTLRPRYPHLEWHFIGPLQSNKTALVAEHFDWIHSIDRLKIAQRLNDQRADNQAPLNVLIQVNTSGEISKSGVDFDEIIALADAIDAMPRLKFRGLMCIPKAEPDTKKQAEAFTAIAEFFNHLKSNYSQVDTLSMGMSGDMEAAILAGSTMVRIGTAIFGERNTSANHN